MRRGKGEKEETMHRNLKERKDAVKGFKEKRKRRRDLGKMGRRVVTSQL